CAIALTGGLDYW
nr:immunoglobulin heavy chain junction region [Macaca mulatta]